jgi:hypothetical protein
MKLTKQQEIVKKTGIDPNKIPMGWQGGEYLEPGKKLPLPSNITRYERNMPKRISPTNFTFPSKGSIL